MAPMSGKSLNPEVKTKTVLGRKFEKVHVSAILQHLIEAKRKKQRGDWEGSILRSGKFVEAVTKALLRFCGMKVPKGRQFKAGVLLRSLENAPTSIDDTIRLVIPRCCLFIYEIASNRGARHDPEEVDPNEIDAGATDVLISWVLGELIRFSSKRAKDPKEALELVASLTEKIYPFFEEIDGRFYVNIEGLSAEKTALLILYNRYPRRITKDFLYELVKRHGFSSNNAGMAIRRVMPFCDVSASGLRIRGLGRERAEKILNNR